MLTGGTDCGIMKYVGQAMSEIQKGIDGKVEGVDDDSNGGSEVSVAKKIGWILGL